LTAPATKARPGASPEYYLSFNGDPISIANKDPYATEMNYFDGTKVGCLGTKKIFYRSKKY
jgi:hypothetical protein